MGNYNEGKMDGEDCRTCTEWETCPNGESGHRNGTSVGYSIGECKDYKRKGEQRW